MASANATSEAVILGLDPGTRVVGWGALILSDAGMRCAGTGALHLGRKKELPERLGELRLAVDRLIVDLRPAVVVIEEAFASRNPQSALRIGEGRGVIIACAVTAGCEVVQYPPAVAKKALVGNGGAHKSQVAGMVCRLLGLEQAPKPLDATDALSLALAYVLRCSPGHIR